MKELTLKEFSEKMNFTTNTVRRWCLKGEEGEVFIKGQWNMKEVRRQLIKTYETAEKAEAKLGFKLEELQLVKSSKATVRDYVKFTVLKEGDSIILHNYSMETELIFIKKLEANETELYIFYKEDEDSYKIYSLEQMSKPNMKVELVK